MRHVDDPRRTRCRLLTVILYLNESWAAGAGGELRLHLREDDGGITDVAPLDNRLVVFWSDGVFPEVLAATSADRYAISVWFGDAQAIAAEERKRTPR